MYIFFFNGTATTEIYTYLHTLSLHDALPIFQAFARKTMGVDLTEVADVEFAAPPLLNQLVLRGDLDAVLNFWHFNARLKAKGLDEVVAVGRILPELGLHRPPPLLGWSFRDSWADQNPDLANGLLKASYAAKEDRKSTRLNYSH